MQVAHFLANSYLASEFSFFYGCNIIKEQNLTQDRLKELLDYNKDTGIFTRNVKTTNLVNIGDIAGYVNHGGYRMICIDYEEYFEHRLAWLYVYGEWPIDQIDHIDNIRFHNWISNLRECNRNENYQNQTKAQARNKSTGVLGAWKNKGANKFRAKIQVNKKQIHLGYFDTVEEAHQAYIKAKRELHPYGML